MTDFFEDINDQHLGLAEEEAEHMVSATAIKALVDRGYLVRRADHEALDETLRDAIAWLRYIHESAMGKALLHAVEHCDICQFIERNSDTTTRSSWVKCAFRRLDEASGFQWGCLKEEGHEGAL